MSTENILQTQQQFCPRLFPIRLNFIFAAIVTLIFLLFSFGAIADTSGRIEVGVGHVGDSQYRYGRYTGLVEEGAAPWLNLDLQSLPEWNSGETDYWSLSAVDVGLDTIQLRGDYFWQAGENGGRGQRLTFNYRELPYYDTRDVSTPFLQVSNNRYDLPANWQVSGNTTDTMTTLNSSLNPFALRSDRHRFDVAYENRWHSAWSIFANWRHEDKDSWRAVAGTIGYNGGNARAALLPASIDYDIDRMELGVRYGAGRGSLLIAYSASLFRNNDTTLNWTNPFGAHPLWAAGVEYPNGRGQLTLEPDNTLHQLRMAMNHGFSNTTRGSASVSYSRLQQDDDFQPYTVNPSLSVLTPLPADSLDGEVATLNADLRLSSYWRRSVQLVARYHLDDRDNQTPRLLYQPIAGDARQQAITTDGFFNRPYSYRRQRAALEANYRAFSRVRFNAGYEVEIMDRDYSEVNHNRERTIILGADIQSFDNISISLDYRHQQRDSEQYVGNRPLLLYHLPGTVAPNEFENHPLLRKYYLTDRQRDGVQSRIDWFVNSRLSLGFSSAYNRDDYDGDNGPHFGLQQATVQSLMWDVNYAAGDRWIFNGFYATDDYQQKQSGRAFTAAPGQVDDPDRNWWVNGDDQFSTLHISAEYQHLQFALLQEWGLRGKISGGLEWSDSRSTSKVRAQVGPALISAPLPELETRIRGIHLYGSYQQADLGEITLTFSRERYRGRDFAFDGVDVDTMANALGLGQTSPNYTVNWFSISYTRRFKSN